jgi:hypothetical protein
MRACWLGAPKPSGLRRSPPIDRRRAAQTARRAACALRRFGGRPRFGAPPQAESIGRAEGEYGGILAHQHQRPAWQRTWHSGPPWPRLPMARESSALSSAWRRAPDEGDRQVLWVFLAPNARWATRRGAVVRPKKNTRGLPRPLAK